MDRDTLSFVWAKSQWTSIVSNSGSVHPSSDMEWKLIFLESPPSLCTCVSIGSFFLLAAAPFSHGQFGRH